MIFSRTLAKFYTIFQILVNTIYTNGHDCEAEAGNSANTLRCRLFSNYNSSISQKKNPQDYVQMLDFRVFYADIDVSGILQLIGEAKAIWKDDQMTWEPNEFNDTYSLDIPNHFHRIWKPDFILINNVFRENKPLLDSYGITTVMYNGTVIFRTSYMSIQAKCQVRVESWPWINHTCQLDLKTSSPNPIFNIHHEKISLAPQIFNNSTGEKPIESPWAVSKTRKVRPINGNSSSDDSLIEVELHRNMDIFKYTECTSYSGSFEAQLKCYLFSKSNLSLPSPIAFIRTISSPLVHLTITYVDLNIEDGILLWRGLISMQWIDERTKWDPKKFGNVLILEIDPADAIWKPSFVLNNYLFHENNMHKVSGEAEGDCKAFIDGILERHLSIKARTRCNKSSNGWPWDPHKCDLDFTVNTPAVYLTLEDTVEEDSDKVESLWTMTEYKLEQDLLNVRIEVTLELKNSSLKVICSTFIAVSLVMLSSFLIPPTSGIKLTSKISSLLLLVLFVAMLMNSVPNFSTKASNFVIGFVVLSLIVGVSGCFTAYFVRLARLTRSSLATGDTSFSLEESRFEVISLDALQLVPIAPTDEERSSDGSGLNKYANKWLRTAVFVELLLFVICLILVIFLIIDLLN